MPKVKVPRKNVSLDMTAMCDVAFLLLTFFILTTSFKPDEPVVVDTPTSIANKDLPEKRLMLVTIDKADKVFFTIDSTDIRRAVLKQMSSKYGVTFTPEEEDVFATKVTSFGLPLAQLKEYLTLSEYDRSKYEQSGIPTDILNNQLKDWIDFSRKLNNSVTIAIKGDRDANYKKASEVINTFQDLKINKFHFVTGMEANPNKQK